MISQLASTGTPPERDQPGCDTSGMVVVHRMFRRLFADAPRLVREVPAGDVKRTTLIGEHILEIAHGLHEHHVSEDEMLWGPLESRSSACAVHVEQMRAQHAIVAELLVQLDAALPVWRGSSDPTDAEGIAALLDAVGTALFRHLGDEEKLILPTAARVMTQHEWDSLGERGLASIPKRRLMIQLGFVLESFAPEERDEWTRSNLPGFVRVLYRLVGRRQYGAHYQAIYGARPS